MFYDIGSNVGVYTILASGVIGCQTIAIEPVKETYDPFNRYLKQLNDYNIHSHNTIYVRNYQMVREIIEKSQKYQIGRYSI